jgi:hypothetical protein
VADGEDSDSGVATINPRIVGVQRMMKNSKIICGQRPLTRRSIRARSTRLAGSVRDRATAVNLATSSSLSANSIARRHPVMVSIPLPNQSSEATIHVSKNESSPYDGFQRIELLGARVFDT